MFDKIFSAGVLSSSKILVFTANDSGDVNISVTLHRTGVRLWPWTQVSMEPVILLKQSSLISVASIASICLKLVSGIVAMDGIGYGGEARIRTGKDRIWNNVYVEGVNNGVRLVTVLQVYAHMPARVKTGMGSSSASAVGLIRTGDFLWNSQSYTIGVYWFYQLEVR